jgi:hypothetical protein
MSQWGAERTFHRGTATVRVCPDVEGERVFAPIRDHHIVRSLIVLDTEGHQDQITALVKSLSEHFIGKPYSTWRAAEKAEEVKDALLDRYSTMVREIKDILRAYYQEPAQGSRAQDAIACIHRVVQGE